ncbi:MAG: TIGR01212 family radical SAM protein [Proteobacteria bacterium]|nr:TIGR01212 family radical SAM protein [Pseudomonadota bacterium]
MNNRYNSINDLLRARFGERVYKVTLESGLGCPNRDGTRGGSGCSFCSEEALVPTTLLGKSGAARPMREQLREGVEYIGKRHGAAKVIAYLQDGSNTHGPVPVVERILCESIDHPSVVGLAVSTRPDCIEIEHARLLSRLADRSMLWVELGLQSAHDVTLERIGRGHTVARFESACRLLNGHAVPVCAHVILGLPGEDRAMIMETARFLNRAKVWGVKIHNLHILRGTRLEREYNEGSVWIPSLEGYARLACDFLEELSPSIVIHRLNAHGPRRLTVAPEWSVNKLGVMNAVHAELARRDSRQGKRFKTGPG